MFALRKDFTFPRILFATPVLQLESAFFSNLLLSENDCRPPRQFCLRHCAGNECPGPGGTIWPTPGESPDGFGETARPPYQRHSFTESKNPFGHPSWGKLIFGPRPILDPRPICTRARVPGPGRSPGVCGAGALNSTSWHHFRGTGLIHGIRGIRM